MKLMLALHAQRLSLLLAFLPTTLGCQGSTYDSAEDLDEGSGSQPENDEADDSETENTDLGRPIEQASGGTTGTSGEGFGSGGAPVTDPPEPKPEPESEPRLVFPPRTLALGVPSNCGVSGDEDFLWCDSGERTASGQPPERDEPPASIGPALAVSMSHVDTCVILRDPPAPDDAIRCWGNQMNQHPAYHPPPIRNPIDISDGERHSCAIDEEGSIVCFGQWGERNQPPEGLKALHIDSAVYNCAITPERSVVCWGPDVQEPPEGLRAKRIAVGGGADGQTQHSCAIDIDDQVVCWGDNTGGVVTDVPTEARAGLDVAVGHQITCVLTLEHRLHCWGEKPNVAPHLREANNRIFANVPNDDDFEYVMMHRYAGVAIRADGSFVPWGAPRNARHAPPFDSIVIDEQ